MSIELTRQAIAGKLNLSAVLSESITIVAAKLYTYLLFLENNDRKPEAELVIDLRTHLFAIRDGITANTVGVVVTPEILSALRHVHSCVRIQHTMLLASKVAWEAAVLYSTLGDLHAHIFLFEDIVKKGMEDRLLTYTEDQTPQPS